MSQSAMITSDPDDNVGNIIFYYRNQSPNLLGNCVDKFLHRGFKLLNNLKVESFMRYNKSNHKYLPTYSMWCTSTVEFDIIVHQIDFILTVIVIQ